MIDFTNQTLILFSTIAGSILLIEFLYHLFIFSRLSFYSTKKLKSEGTSNPNVSVIICANNEANNLEKNIPLICSQQYPNFEVIVVDDGSNDNTLNVLDNLKQEFSNLTVTYTNRIDLIKRGKKIALTLGIKAAKHEYILLTDADCKPNSKNWISEMVLAKNLSNKDIVLGISPYKKKKGFLNKIIQFETAQTALHFLSFSLAKIPYMGLGRNMMYRKELFFDISGFSSHNHIMSGDDDLFIRDIANSKNTSICIAEDSHIISTPSHNFRAWFQQKKRHMHTGKYYKASIKFLLSIFYASHVLFFLTPLFIFIHQDFWLVFIALLIFRWITFTIIQGKAFNKMGYKHLWLWVPFFDIFMVFYYIIFGTISWFSEQTKW